MKKTAVQTKKYLKLAELLRQEIAHTAPGSAFLTVRQIIERFDMSQATTTKALEILTSEGLIEKSWGSGIYVTEKAALLKSRSSTICLAMPNWPSSRLQSYELEFNRLSGDMGFIPEVLRFDWNDALPLKLPPFKIDALAIYSAAQEHMLVPRLPQLQSFNIPFVFINRNLGDLGVNCVYCDDRDEGAIAADHLIKAGHRRIAAFISEPRTKSIDNKVEGFVKYAKLQGVEAQVIDPAMRNGELSHEVTYQNMKRILSTGKPDFTAIFTVSSDPVLGLYKAVYEAGLKIPEDISVIAADDIVQNKYMHPPLSCIDEKPEEILRTALKLLTGNIKENKPESISISPTLIRRDSV